jgi:hypothetical protein
MGFLFRVHGQEFHSFRRATGSQTLRELPLRPSESSPQIRLQKEIFHAVRDLGAWENNIDKLLWVLGRNAQVV